MHATCKYGPHQKFPERFSLTESPSPWLFTYYFLCLLRNHTNEHRLNNVQTTASLAMCASPEQQTAGTSPPPVQGNNAPLAVDDNVREFLGLYKILFLWFSLGRCSRWWCWFGIRRGEILCACENDIIMADFGRTTSATQPLWDLAFLHIGRKMAGRITLIRTAVSIDPFLLRLHGSLIRYQSTFFPMTRLVSFFVWNSSCHVFTNTLFLDREWAPR